jgi:2',3'-cyclic-nucleotide 2'-phosphodiesterase
MAKILFFGDIVGKPGRRSLAQVLPMLRKVHNPDVVIANVENLAHGKGVTTTTLKELTEMGVDVFTSGNHVFDKKDQADECFKNYPNLIRPANYEDSYPGQGYYRFQKNNQWYTVINLGGQVFFEKQFGGVIKNPFFTVDEILSEVPAKDDIILVDLHAEATSEKRAMGLYLNGRVTALVGTHTHVPTADAQILPKAQPRSESPDSTTGGTAYVTDLGMTGPIHSVIGVKIDNALHAFLEKGKFRMEPEEEGPAMVNAVLITVAGGTATAIERIYREV